MVSSLLGLLFISFNQEEQQERVGITTMEPVNVILTALGGAFATSSQAALNDIVKDAFDRLKKRIYQAFSGRPEALMVLNEYEHDPETWERPLRGALIKAGLPQDEATIKLAQQ